MNGILLVNLGTPNAPNPRAVGSYLREFLSDPLVLTINPIFRWILVNFFIVPVRSRRSSHAYQQIWTPTGSPLLKNSIELKLQLQKCLGTDYHVELAMRYGNPSVDQALINLKSYSLRRLIVVPLYPQQARSSTETCYRSIKLGVEKFNFFPKPEFFPPFFNEDFFIQAYVDQIQKVLSISGAEQVLFSYHGVPADQDGRCYEAQCLETSRLLIQALGLTENCAVSAFQSRFGRAQWLEPYTDQVIRELAQKGCKKLVVACPSFVADCLETLEEIGMRARKIFIDFGGQEFSLVPALNAESIWVQALSSVISQIKTETEKYK